MARTREAPASLEKRAAALEMVLRRKADMPENFVGEFTEHADDAWITANGARMVARAWTDPEYRTRMLADGTAAARELGFDFPEHHRNLVVLENTPTVHNVIVCTLSAPYFERHLTAIATLLVEKGIVTRQELESLAGGPFPLSGPLLPPAFPSECPLLDLEPGGKDSAPSSHPPRR